MRNGSLNKSDIERLTEALIVFRDARDWKQFHNPKDLAITLMLEAGEVAEHFQWKNEAEIAAHSKAHKKDIAEELADVLNCVLVLAHDLDIDMVKASESKVRKNTKRYPVKKSRGSHKKYNQL